MIENIPLNTLPKEQFYDLIEQLAENIETMLTVVTGDGAETFSRYSDDVQQNYLYAIRQQAKMLKRAIHEEHSR